MAIVLADNTPRIEYTVAQGVTQTVFPIPFAFFNKEDSSNVDVKVFVDGVERTLGSISTTTFSITSGGNGAKGSLSTTVTGISGGSTVIVLRDTKIGRTTDFPSGGAFEVSKLNTELDTLVAIEGDFEDHVSRSIRLQDKDTAVSLALPLKADRLGKQLGFNATTGAVQMFTPESLAIASDSGSSSVDLTSNTFTFTGGEGIDTSISNQTLTITGELASTSNKGVASFNSTNFTVSSGAVTAKDITLASDSGSATNTLGETFTLSGGTGLNTSATGSTVTMNVDAAQTGITSLLATDIKIGEDDQTKIDFETADQINFYANNVNVVQLSNANSGDAVFTVPTSDKDFVIKGNDGGSPVTALSIDMSDAGSAIFNNDVSVNGNLTVTGTTTTVNSTTVNIADHNIVLDSDNSTSAVINGAGITIEGGSGDDATFTYNTIGPKFELKLGSSYEDLQVDNLIAAQLTGTIQTASQTNITSLGTLTGLTIDGDTTFTGANGNIVFDKSDDALEFADNVKAVFGTSGDLKIYHNGSFSFIEDSGTGAIVVNTNALQLKSADNNEFMMLASQNGSVDLYYDNSKKFETTSTGATVTGTLSATLSTASQPNITSVGTLAGLTVNSTLNVNPKINVESTGGYGAIEIGGASGGFIDLKTPFSDDHDFRFITDGTNSDIRANLLTLESLTGEEYIVCTKDGSVDLYHNDVKKFETTSTGATVTGELTADGAIFGDDDRAKFGNSTDLQIYHDGIGSNIINTTGNLIIADTSGDVKIQGKYGEQSIVANNDGSVELYHDNVKKVETTSTGATVTGELVVDDLRMTTGANSLLKFTSADGSEGYQLKANVSNSADFGLLIEDLGNNDIAKFLDGGECLLTHNHITRFQTTSTGATVTGALTTTEGITVTGGNSGDNLLTFATDRSWAFKQSGDDATTRLQLRASSPSKSFDIVNSSDQAQFTFSTPNDPQFTITSYADDADASPTLVLYRNSASPADNDLLGNILFRGRNDNSQDVEYAQIHAKITDASDGNEAGYLEFKVIDNGNLNVYAQMAFSNFYVFKQLTMFNTLYMHNGHVIKFEGATGNAHETTLTVTDPTADRTITLPDATGTINELLISSGSVSNVSSIDFNSSILTTEFSSYRLVLLNVKSATDNVTASFRLGTGNSADTGNNYMQNNWVYGVYNNGGSTGQSGVSQISHETDQMVLAKSFANLGTGTGENAHFEISLLNANSTSCYKHIRLNQSIYSYFPVMYGRRMDAGLYKTNSAINFMTIFLGSGNIASADYRLYGVK